VSAVSKARRGLYRWARILGDAEAAEKGPSAYARRRLRRSVYREEGKLTRRLFRKLGL
jgi:hypothetical protein